MKSHTLIIVVASLFLSEFHAEALTRLATLMPYEGKFLTVIDGMKEQAGDDFRFFVIDMNKSPGTEEIVRQCKSNNVEGLILMDTKAIKAAVELEMFDSSFRSLPKFALMTLMVESSSQGLSNIAGIRFEVPFYTVVTNFRIISIKDFTRVGIFYRSSFKGMIEESRKLLEREGIAISPVCVDCENKTGSDNALKIMTQKADYMIRNEKIDVYLIPADNLIINSGNLNVFWIDKVKKKNIPAIAPLDMLASEKLGVAVFAADPDLLQLGAQAVGQIVDHFENKTPMKKIGFEPTISIKSTLNMRVAREIGWKIRDDKIGRINTIIK